VASEEEARGGITGSPTLWRRLAGSFWVRALVSAGLLAAVATQIDFQKAWDQLAAGEWQFFVLAVFVLLAAFAVASVRWLLYLKAASVETTFQRTLRAYLIGVFTTNFLPSQVGGDVARAWIVSRPGTRTRSATTVVVDRATALGCLLVVAWVAFASEPGPVPESLIVTLGVVSTGFAVASVVLLALVYRGGRLGQRLPIRLQSHARDVRAATHACLSGGVLWRTIALGLVVQGLATLSAWLVARAISLDVAFSSLVVTLPLVVALAVVPFSIGGLGIREGGFVVLLGQAGVSATEATVFSLLSAAAFAIASLPGALLLLQRQRTVAILPEETSARARPASGS
jgi:uncharacterized protein (TIRG00374 family)